jgi:hypothetical protein
MTNQLRSIVEGGSNKKVDFDAHQNNKSFAPGQSDALATEAPG